VEKSTGCPTTKERNTMRKTGQGMNLKTAVNAKTPRGKGARNREMARERQA
jgi:hypothetical protein